jgi:hypothetical protein
MRLQSFEKGHDELSKNPSKTSMNRRSDFKKFPVIFPVLRESRPGASPGMSKSACFDAAARLQTEWGMKIPPLGMVEVGFCGNELILKSPAKSMPSGFLAAAIPGGGAASWSGPVARMEGALRP